MFCHVYGLWLYLMHFLCSSCLIVAHFFFYLVLNEGVDSLQHPLTGELVGQVGLDLITGERKRKRTLCVSLFHCMCVCLHVRAR